MGGPQESKIIDGQEWFGSPNAKAIADLFTIEQPPERFLTELLATQCRLAEADAAVILRSGDSGQTEVLAAYPSSPNTDPALAWIGMVDKPFRQVMQSGQTAIVRKYLDLLLHLNLMIADN